VVQATSAADNTPTFAWDASTDVGSGVAYYEVSIDSGSYTNVGDVTTYTVAPADALSDGSHTFRVRAVDSAANVGTAADIPVNIDVTPPTTPDDLVKSTPDRVNTPTFTWNEAADVTSGLARYQVKIDEGEFTNIGTLATFTVDDDDPLADGNHVVEVRAVDRAGNAGEAASLSFAIDATAPTTPANVARTSPEADDTPTFTWDAATDVTSGVDHYLVRIDSGEFVEIGDVTTFTVENDAALTGGSHVFEVKAVDVAGNVGKAGSIAFQIAGPSSWAMILGIVAGVVVAVAIAAFLLGGSLAARPTGRRPTRIIS
jgi:predicted phage tail protein